MINQLPGTEGISLVPYVFSNLYLIESEGGLVLVDTGIKGSTGKVLRAVRDLGYVPQDLHTILLTHAHFDHFGSAHAIQARTGASIMGHVADLGGFEKGGLGIMPPPLGWFQDRFAPLIARSFGAPAVKLDRLLVDGDRVGEWRVVHTPGHTPGTISLFSGNRNVLITGGWAVDQKMPRLRKRRSGPAVIGFISTDPSEIVNARQRLSQLDFKTLLCSHLNPRFFPFFARELRSGAA